MNWFDSIFPLQISCIANLCDKPILNDKINNRGTSKTKILTKPINSSNNIKSNNSVSNPKIMRNKLLVNILDDKPVKKIITKFRNSDQFDYTIKNNRYLKIPFNNSVKPFNNLDSKARNELKILRNRNSNRILLQKNSLVSKTKDGDCFFRLKSNHNHRSSGNSNQRIENGLNLNQLNHSIKSNDNTNTLQCRQKAIIQMANSDILKIKKLPIDRKMNSKSFVKISKQNPYY